MISLQLNGLQLVSNATHSLKHDCCMSKTKTREWSSRQACKQGVAVEVSLLWRLCSCDVLGRSIASPGTALFTLWRYTRYSRRLFQQLFQHRLISGPESLVTSQCTTILWYGHLLAPVKKESREVWANVRILQTRQLPWIVATSYKYQECEAQWEA
jgi:hypothetical protein